MNKPDDFEKMSESDDGASNLTGALPDALEDEAEAEIGSHLTR
ncbi:hypothetical protein [Jonesia quinghaiensis]|nr:hypothetical protein [Jonesia quinghaiensis]